jgi:DNA mismatch endonuclease (patch repair protein)
MAQDLLPVDPVVSARMAKVRRRDTKPELALRRELHRRGRRYFVDRPVLGKRGRPDLVFPRQHVAVFVDGCYWHACPDHLRPARANAEWWTEKLRRNVERDRQTDSDLEAAGWTVIRVWEHEEPRQAADRVESVLRPKP